MKHLDQRIRVPIELDNPSIARDESRCIKCGNCSKVCEKYLSVLSEYDLKKTRQAICVNCGQCLQACPVGSIVEKSSINEIKETISSGKKVIISTSPAVRVSLGEEFGLGQGSLVEGKMVAMLKKLGFSYILDTNFGADVTTVEETTELIDRLNKNQGVMFSSCCPSWVKFCEIFYPELILNLSTCRSPIAMQGALIKTYFANKSGIDPRDIVNVCLTPCVAKKMEISRPLMNKSGQKIGEDFRDMDYCLTVREIAEWAIEEGIDFLKLKDAKFDKPMSTSSGAGAIFGRSGGVCESIIRTLKDLSKDKNFDKKIHRYQESPSTKFIDCEFGGKKLKIVAVYGLKNTRELIARIKSGEHFDFVEVMACPGGCIGGGGQPKDDSLDPSICYDRMKGLNRKDRQSSIKSPLDNNEMKKMYNEYLNKDKGFTHSILHTSYENKSNILKAKRSRNSIMYKCEICGNVFSNKIGDCLKCPKCGQVSDNIEKIN